MNFRNPGRTPFPAAGALEFLRPALTAFPIPGVAWDRLREATLALAHVPQLALEIKLNEEEIEPDLHQLVSLGTGEAEELTDFLHTEQEAGPYSKALLSSLQAWRSAATRGIVPDHIYLEWDHPGLGLAPSVFLPVIHQMRESIRRRFDAQDWQSCRP